MPKETCDTAPAASPCMVLNVKYIPGLVQMYLFMVYDEIQTISAIEGVFMV